MNFTNSKNSRGFTIIELLLVMVIIGALAAVVLVSTTNSRLKARDAQRVSDLTQIQFALERYYDDNGYFPTCSNKEICCSLGACGANSGSWQTLGITTTNPPYLKPIPTDPINKDFYSYYYARGYRKTTNNPPCTYTGQPSDYIIATRLEQSGFTAFSGCWNNPYLNIIFGNE